MYTGLWSCICYLKISLNYICNWSFWYAIYTFFQFFLAYANQGEPGLNEHTLDERPLPSSSLSFPVSPNVLRLINSTSTTNGPIKANLSTALASSGSTSVIEKTTVAQSQTSTMILAHTSISRGDVLTRLPQITTMTVLNQSVNTTLVASSKAQTINLSTTSILAHTSTLGSSISRSG